MRNVVVYCMPKYPANMKARELSSDMHKLVGHCLTLYGHRAAVQYVHMLMVLSCTIILLYEKALV